MTKTYFDEYTECEITVEEMSRKEALQYAIDFIDGIETAGILGYSSDTSVYVEYKDGSCYINIDGDVSGTLKKQNIKAIILDDGYEYYIYGEYKMNENMIPEVA
ncbi:MAG: hypothetical protein MJ193_00415 [Clostridia bacterium]|nr:hypothetical protein [Clostridia bacterium]